MEWHWWDWGGQKKGKRSVGLRVRRHLVFISLHQMPVYWLVCLLNRWIAVPPKSCEELCVCVCVYITGSRHEYKFYMGHMSAPTPPPIKWLCEKVGEVIVSERLFSFYSEPLWWRDCFKQTGMGRAEKGQVWPEITTSLKWHIPVTKAAMDTPNTHTHTCHVSFWVSAVQSAES